MPDETRAHCKRSKFLFCAAVAAVAALALAGIRVHAGAVDTSRDAPTNSLPNPYKTVENWAKLPEGWTWGQTGVVTTDNAGHIWVLQRCGGNTCVGATEDPVLEFDLSGTLLKHFGSGMFVVPHGLTVDKDGNVWVTDFQMKDGKGMQVFKFSPDGKVLMTLGKAGVAGDGPDEFSQPIGLAIAPNGDIFVADGHGMPGSNARVVKFSKDGKFIKTWGQKGTGPGEFDGLHAIVFDNKGRLLVGDRGNARIEIFDQDGKFITEWKQFGRPSGIYIDKKDNIYVADADSNAKSHPGWLRGIRVGSMKDGLVKYFIPDPNADPNFAGSSAAEGVAADAQGNIYGAEVGPKDLKKYVKQ